MSVFDSISIMSRLVEAVTVTMTRKFVSHLNSALK